MTVLQETILSLCEQLKLPGIADHYLALAQQAA